MAVVCRVPGGERADTAARGSSLRPRLRWRLALRLLPPRSSPILFFHPLLSLARKDRDRGFEGVWGIVWSALWWFFTRSTPASSNLITAAEKSYILESLSRNESEDYSVRSPTLPSPPIHHAPCLTLRCPCRK